MENKIRRLFGLGIGLLTNGIVLAGFQALAFHSAWGTTKDYQKLALTGVGFGSGLFILMTGIVNLCIAYRIRQDALFNFDTSQQNKLDQFRKDGRSVLVLNILGVALLLPSLVISIILAVNIIKKGDFWQVVNFAGQIQESADELILAGAVAMGIFTILGVVLSSVAATIGRAIVQHARSQITRGPLPYQYSRFS